MRWCLKLQENTHPPFGMARDDASVSRKRTSGGSRCNDVRGNAATVGEPDTRRVLRTCALRATPAESGARLSSAKLFLTRWLAPNPNFAEATPATGDQRQSRGRGRPRRPNRPRRSSSAPPPPPVFTSPRRTRGADVKAPARFSPGFHSHRSADGRRGRIRDGARAPDDDDDDDDDLAGVRVIWELSRFEETLNALPCNHCRRGYLRLRRDVRTGEVVDDPMGLAHMYTIECGRCCTIAAEAPTSTQLLSDGPGRRAWEVNRATVVAGELTGVRRAKQTRFLNKLGVDGIQKDSTYTAHAEHVREVLRELSEAQILENRARVRKHMMEVHGADTDEHGRVGIMVSADGS